MNKWQRKIEETRQRINDLDEKRVQMVKEHEKPVVIHAICDAYLREREKIEVYEYCSTH